MLVENIATTEFFCKQNLGCALLKRKIKYHLKEKNPNMFMITPKLHPKPPPE